MKLKSLKILLLFFSVLYDFNVYAQQDPMYTQYMYNTMSVNPAYAGSKEALSITGLMRIQWAGFKGAPRTQTLTMHSPVFNENMGLGLTVVNDDIRPVHNTMLYGDYSYSIQTTDYAKLSFGLKAGVSIYQADLMGESSINPDPDIVNIDNVFLPNVGIGIYYHSDRGYFGVSAPRLLQHNLKTKQSENITELRHYFLIGGYVFELNEDMKIKPAFLLKTVPGAPIEFDISANVFIQNRFGVGVAYRTGDALSGLIQYYVTPQFRFGYAYDFTLTELRHYNSGTHEIMLSYDFTGGEDVRIHAPRFF